MQRTMQMMKNALPLFAALTLAACTPLQQQASNGEIPVGTGSSVTMAASDNPAVEGDSQSSATPAITPVDERLLPSGALEIGKAEAPVSLLLFTNHSCAYCRDFHDDLLPRLMDDFVRKGTLRISVIPYNLQKYSESREASGMLICAAQQHKGWAMHDLLFRENMKSTAFKTALSTLQIDADAIQACAQSDGVITAINVQQSMADLLGVNLVPAYFINGTMYVGLPEYADLRGQIEHKLTMNN